MVSWDLEVKFLGFSPNVNELLLLSKQEGFSNIENMEFLRLENKNSVYRLEVNNRGLLQKEFKFEKVERGLEE